ncbi:putative phosphatidic acid phosphatase [Leptomonas seymouri]|uniref:Putative phosphatidic acid phosphatase n=1 Tax=Leptomonas seymouri TaxID=5684 RepID=A0A0N1I046_LEPSE|nr:putative phosphatidic acid phosphatase [Leptomonas seymouri]|eukprot:KPI83231.1 putative phosphatidic acid phosphatase [Leptomonas seymouri]
MEEGTLDKIIRVIVFFRLQDYLLCLICGLVACGVRNARPHCRPFSWRDGTIDFPYGGEGTFPLWTLPIISILPGAAYVIGEAARHLWWERRRTAGARNGIEPPHEMRLLRSLELKHSVGRRGVEEEDCQPSANSWNERRSEDEGARVESPRRGQRPDSPFPLPTISTSQQGRQKASSDTVSSEESVSAAMVLENDARHHPYEQEEAGVAPAPDAGLLAIAHAAASSPVVNSVVSPGLTNLCTDYPHSLPLGYANRLASRTTGSRRGHSNRSPFPNRRNGEAAATTSFSVPLCAPWERFVAHTHMWVLTQAFAVTFAILVVCTVKVYAGRLRPDFLSRLRREGYSETSVGVDWCEVGKGGRVSFPSGHSAISFAAFVPFSFYVMHTLHVFRRSGVLLWRIVVGLLPQILPITVAVSRTRDYRHNYDDILAGSLIGIASALMALGTNLMVNEKTGQLMPRLPGGE